MCHLRRQPTHCSRVFLKLFSRSESADGCFIIVQLLCCLRGQDRTFCPIPNWQLSCLHLSLFLILRRARHKELLKIQVIDCNSDKINFHSCSTGHSALEWFYFSYQMQTECQQVLHFSPALNNFTWEVALSYKCAIIFSRLFTNKEVLSEVVVVVVFSLFCFKVCTILNIFFFNLKTLVTEFLKSCLVGFRLKSVSLWGCCNDFKPQGRTGTQRTFFQRCILIHWSTVK